MPMARIQSGLRRSLSTGVVRGPLEFDGAWSADGVFMVALFRMDPACTIAVGVGSRLVGRGCAPISWWAAVISAVTHRPARRGEAWRDAYRCRRITPPAARGPTEHAPRITVRCLAGRMINMGFVLSTWRWCVFLDELLLLQLGPELRWNSLLHRGHVGKDLFFAARPDDQRHSDVGRRGKL
jgi:hypothetical protein